MSSFTYKLEVNAETVGEKVEVSGRLIDIADKGAMVKDRNGKHVPSNGLNLYVGSAAEAKALGESLLKLASRMEATKDRLESDMRVDREVAAQMARNSQF